MEEREAIDLLQSHGVKPTANRILIVKELASAQKPMSMKELEYSILTIDKSNIFRALMLFRKHRLVHVIDEGENGTGYELCLSTDEENDEDEHAHFYCEECHRTFCLHDTPVPAVELPEGYQPISTSYLIHGICAECMKKHPHF
jgi:Fur family ferric uptake transcriptional regulator